MKLGDLPSINTFKDLFKIDDYRKAKQHYDECKIKPEAVGCKKLILFERFLDTGLPFWKIILLPLIFILMLPFIVALCILSDGAYIISKAFGRLGLDLSCAESITKIVVYAIVAYVAISIVWAWRTCGIPPTLTFPIDAVVIIGSALISIVSVCVAVFMWYYALLFPCNAGTLINGFLLFCNFYVIHLMVIAIATFIIGLYAHAEYGPFRDYVRNLMWAIAIVSIVCATCGAVAMPAALANHPLVGPQLLTNVTVGHFFCDTNDCAVTLATGNGITMPIASDLYHISKSHVDMLSKITGTSNVYVQDNLVWVGIDCRSWGGCSSRVTPRLSIVQVTP